MHQITYDNIVAGVVAIGDAMDAEQWFPSNNKDKQAKLSLESFVRSLNRVNVLPDPEYGDLEEPLQEQKVSKKKNSGPKITRGKKT